MHGVLISCYDAQRRNIRSNAERVERGSYE